MKLQGLYKEVREAGEIGQKRFKEAMQLALKMEEETTNTSKGMQEAS